MVMVSRQLCIAYTKIHCNLKQRVELALDISEVMAWRLTAVAITARPIDPIHTISTSLTCNNRWCTHMLFYIFRRVPVAIVCTQCVHIRWLLVDQSTSVVNHNIYAMHTYGNTVRLFQLEVKCALARIQTQTNKYTRAHISNKWTHSHIHTHLRL